MITRLDTIAEARSWLGTPFQHQGCLKGVACDCIGLVKGVGLALGLVNYDEEKAKPYLGYRMMPDSKKMREALATFFVPIPVQEATLADILFMAWTKEPQHLAIITECGIIHSYSGVGKVIEHSCDERWQRRITAAYRYPYFAGHRCSKPTAI